MWTDEKQYFLRRGQSLRSGPNGAGGMDYRPTPSFEDTVMGDPALRTSGQCFRPLWPTISRTQLPPPTIPIKTHEGAATAAVSKGCASKSFSLRFKRALSHRTSVGVLAAPLARASRQ